MNDLEVLSRIIWGEGESESLTSKMGIGASIRNQARAENKPVMSIVEKPGQFEAFSNNRFWQAPYQEHREPMMSEARQAASRVLSGEDPVGNNTHFCAFHKDPCRWHYEQTPPLQYLGNHLFVRSKEYEERRR